jgi:hypothetical protein
MSDDEWHAFEMFVLDVEAEIEIMADSCWDATQENLDMRASLLGLRSAVGKLKERLFILGLNPPTDKSYS